ncbi:MAG: succinate--CoA ligase subunit alpha [bacterium]
MAIIITKENRVIVQGITGREGQVRTKLMMEYGSNVVGGVTPGRGGETVMNLPVFDTVAELVENMGGVDTSVIFVPAHLVKDAAIEAILAGVKLLVIVPDRVPVHDVIEIAAHAKKHGAEFIGPNTLGILSVDEGILGMIGGKASSAKAWFKKGSVGVTSRSGGITSSISYYLSQAGVGLSTIVHVGGDGVIGMPHNRIMELFQDDPQTELIVMFGEIGTSQEEAVAEMIKTGKLTKPVVAYVGGKGAKKGTRFSHAGAIVEGNKGSWEGKVGALREAGAHVVENFQEIPAKVLEVLKNI